MKLISTQDEIKLIVSELSSLSENEISAEDKLINLGIDSLMTVELIIRIEEQFDIEFDEAELDLGLLTTVQALIDLVERYV